MSFDFEISSVHCICTGSFKEHAKNCIKCFLVQDRNYFTVYFNYSFFREPFFHNTQGILYSRFQKCLNHKKLFLHSFNMAKPATFFADFPVNRHPSTSGVIRCYTCRNTYEGCDLIPLVTSSIGDSELIIHFQEAYARFFPNCYMYNKQGIQSNLPSYTPNEPGNYLCESIS